MRRGRTLLTLTLIGALAIGAFSVRKRFIATFFRDGPPAPAPALPPAEPRPLRTVAQVRVVLVDGLGREAADGLIEFSRLCRQGANLTVDVGYPTVSLPVQAVFWTGKTQQQLGLLYRVKGLEPPLADAAPARIAGSIAVAEEQPFIARSFGFREVLPVGVAPPVGWGAAGFAEAARTAVAGDAPLAFVHILGVDKAGHRAGGASLEYAGAAAAADRLLGELVRAAPPGPARRWFVLSDHGHRARGGHGGAEPEVRIVRACVIDGPGGFAGRGGHIHLVDLARALFDSLGLTLPPDAAGRSLLGAISRGIGPGSVPRVPLLRAALAALLAVAVLVLGWRLRGVVGGRAPLATWSWLPLAWAALLVIAETPTLSNPIIYPPLGRDIWLAAAPGLLVLVAAVAHAGCRGVGPALALGAFALTPAVALALAALVACGGFVALLGGAPPLVEPASGYASVFLALTAVAGALVALVAPISALAFHLARRRART